MTTENEQRLQDRIEELQGLLGMKVDALCLLGLTTKQSILVGMLMRRQAVTREGMFSAIYGALPETQQPDLSVVNSLIHQCRCRLKKYGVEIHTVPKRGDGYHIPDKHKKALQRRIDIWERAAKASAKVRAA